MKFWTCGRSILNMLLPYWTQQISEPRTQKRNPPYIIFIRKISNIWWEHCIYKRNVWLWTLDCSWTEAAPCGCWMTRGRQLRCRRSRWWRPMQEERGSLHLQFSPVPCTTTLHPHHLSTAAPRGHPKLAEHVSAATPANQGKPRCDLTPTWTRFHQKVECFLQFSSSTSTSPSTSTSTSSSSS